MKKIFTISVLIVLLSILLPACIKDYSDFDENYWLSKEKGIVVFSGNCGYYVVETAYGYTILHSSGTYQPYEGEFLYGNFSIYGFREFYNRSARKVFTAEVIEYRLSYLAAQEAIYYYCPEGKSQFNKSFTGVLLQK